MKQTELAKKASISNGFLSQILSGDRTPSWQVAKRLTNGIPGTSPEFWIEGKPEKKKEAVRRAKV